MATASAIGLSLLTGCGIMTNQAATDIPHDPADGTSARIKQANLFNLVVINDGKATDGQLSGMAINRTPKPVKLTISIGGTDTQVSLGPMQAVRLDGQKNGNNDRTIPAIKVKSLGGKRVGEQMPLKVKAENGGSTETKVPIVLDQYPYGTASPSHATAEPQEGKSEGH